MDRSGSDVDARGPAPLFGTTAMAPNVPPYRVDVRRTDQVFGDAEYPRWRGDLSALYRLT